MYRYIYILHISSLWLRWQAGGAAVDEQGKWLAFSSLLYYSWLFGPDQVCLYYMHIYIHIYIYIYRI